MSQDIATDMSVIGHLLDDYVEWVQNETDGAVSVDYLEDEDVFSLERGDGPPVAVFASEIDHKFYHEEQAVFIEAEVGEPFEELDLAVVMQFSGDELVLSRISLSERGDEDDGTQRRVIVVEAALPNSKVEFSLLDLMIREVATITNDLRSQLGFSREAIELRQEDAPELEDEED